MFLYCHVIVLDSVKLLVVSVFLSSLFLNCVHLGVQISTIHALTGSPHVQIHVIDNLDGRKVSFTTTQDSEMDHKKKAREGDRALFTNHDQVQTSGVVEMSFGGDNQCHPTEEPRRLNLKKNTGIS